MKNKRTVLLIVIGIVAAIVAGWIAFSLLKKPHTDQVIEELRKAPLLGQVMTDIPSVEARLRTAIDDDQRDPLPNRSRAFEAIVEVRKNYIVPALQSASDAVALDTMAKRAALARHLKSNNVSACRQFAGIGIRDVDKLDSDGRRLFMDVLSAMEAAYRSGRGAGAGSKPAMAQDEYVALLRSTGFTDADFRKLDTPALLSDGEVCDLEIRIDSAPTQVAEDRRGAFARFVLAR